MKRSINSKTLLFRKNSLVNISRTCVFVFVFNTCIKSSLLAQLRILDMLQLILISFLRTKIIITRKK
jgi:hypothetical protein